MGLNRSHHGVHGVTLSRDLRLWSQGKEEPVSRSRRIAEKRQGRSMLFMQSWQACKRRVSAACRINSGFEKEVMGFPSSAHSSRAWANICLA